MCIMRFCGRSHKKKKKYLVSKKMGGKNGTFERQNPRISGTRKQSGRLFRDKTKNGKPIRGTFPLIWSRSV